MAGIRKTWDKAEYEAKAIARLERGGEDEDADYGKSSVKRKRTPEVVKEEFRVADAGY
jgi:hypothetical protein